MELNPISRLENFLARIGGDTTVDPIEPLSRFEGFLDQIASHIKLIAKKAGKTDALTIYVDSFDSDGNAYQDRDKTPFQDAIFTDIENYREIRVRTVSSAIGHGKYYLASGVIFNSDGRIQDRHFKVVVGVPTQDNTFAVRIYTLYRGNAT